jgi:hypothetical protein
MSGVSWPVRTSPPGRAFHGMAAIEALIRRVRTRTVRRQALVLSRVNHVDVFFCLEGSAIVAPAERLRNADLFVVHQFVIYSSVDDVQRLTGAFVDDVQQWSARTPPLLRNASALRHSL